MPAPRPCEKCGKPYSPLRRGYCHSCDMSRRHKIGYQCSYVDADPVREHYQNLRAAGIGRNQVSRLTGVSRHALDNLVNGKKYGKPTQRLHRKTADRILALPVPDVKHRLAADHCIVPALGTIRRLQSLVAFGYPRSYLALRLGVTKRNSTRLFLDTTSHVYAKTARKVEELFCELEATPGPSSRARNDGRKRGWKVPMMWDEDIDRIEAEPASDLVIDVSFQELYDELVGLGYSDWEIFSRHAPDRKDVHEAIDVLTVKGLSASEIADLLKCSPRTVTRGRSVKNTA